MLCRRRSRDLQRNGRGEIELLLEVSVRRHGLSTRAAASASRASSQTCASASASGAALAWSASAWAAIPAESSHDSAERLATSIDEASGERDRQRRRGAAARRRLAGAEPLQEVAELQLEVRPLAWRESRDVYRATLAPKVRGEMGEVIDAIRTFFEQLADVEWTPLAIACGLQVVRLFFRAVAWRSIIAAASP